MHLEGEPDALLVEDVQDGIPPPGEVRVAFVDLLLARRREEVQLVPDGGSGEARDDVHPEPGRGPRRVLHLLGGPPAHALLVSVAADVRGQGGLVAGVYERVADGLADEVVADGVAFEAVLREQATLLLDVIVFREGLPHLEVVAPAGELQAVVAHLLGEWGQLLERQVGPLPGEQGDWSCHGSSRLGLRIRYACPWRRGRRRG